MKAGSKVIVSGSSGTIGTALCERLLKERFELVGIDIKPNPWSPLVQGHTVLADLRNPSELDRLSQSADFFVHLAANPFVFPSVQNPQLAFDNLWMTLNCLEFCRKNSIRRFVFASSREIYGNSQKKVYKETDFCIENTESPYAASKVAGESFVHAYQKCYGIDFEILRFSNVYGRFDNSNRLIPQLFRKNRANEDITIFGEQKALSFTHLDDAVEGILSGIQHFEKARNRAYNIAFPRAVKILDVANRLQKCMGSKSKTRIEKTRMGEVEFFCPNISLAKKMLGFEPKIGIKEGIEKTVAWYQKNLGNP